jgi:hypothetical protein
VLPRLSEGSEHRVFVDVPAGRVYKHTLPGTFGDTYFIVNGRVHQRRCLPSDYLARLHLWQKVFGPPPIALGITASGQFVTEQRFVTGDVPSQQEVDDYLWAEGLVDVKRQCFVWRKTVLGSDIWVGDTRDENFVKTANGIVPIDVRLWIQD